MRENVIFFMLDPPHVSFCRISLPLFFTQKVIWFKCSQLSRCCSARGSGTRFPLAGPSKVKSGKSFLITEKFPCNENKEHLVVGRRSIVDKSSANGTKGPGLKPRWRQEFININFMFCSFEKIKLWLGPTLKKKKNLVDFVGTLYYYITLLQSFM